MRRNHTAVLDVGKTHSKLSLWSRDGEMIRRETRPNERQQAGPYAALDAEGIGAWALETLRDFAEEGAITAIAPVSHGAAVAAIRDDRLTAAPMDYEFALPADMLAAYRAQRDSFDDTGSPALPDGLNIGAQLHFIEETDPAALAGATLLPWAQYWAWFLSGAAHSEATSLGCHSDLWSPWRAAFSPLAQRRGWAEKFAPLARAGDVVGKVRPDIADATGLPSYAKIHCGLHDSNAALVAARGYREITGAEATVLSTGTWFIAMRTPEPGAAPVALSAERDCLVNVDIKGRAVPSSRFMGGRELEMLLGGDGPAIDGGAGQQSLIASAERIVQAGAMVLPALANGSGPFPDARGYWSHEPDDAVDRRAAACLYAALMTDVALDLVGAKDVLLIEGRFAKAAVFTRALASIRPQMTVYTAEASNDVSFGALCTLRPDLSPAGALRRVEPLDADLRGYRAAWRAKTEARRPNA